MLRCALGGKFEDPFAPTNTLAAKAPSSNRSKSHDGIEQNLVQYVSRLANKDMRIAARFLAILSIAALLAPGVRWAILGIQGEACACPPAACMCVSHQRAPGQVPICCLGKGGHCGLESHDNYLSTLLSTLIYVPTEHHWWHPLAQWNCGYEESDLNLLPSHARIPWQPPRVTP
jgi:hypothetical protein